MRMKRFIWIAACVLLAAGALKIAISTAQIPSQRRIESTLVTVNPDGDSVSVNVSEHTPEQEEESLVYVDKKAFDSNFN